jgi:hypothetical protein
MIVSCSGGTPGTPFSVTIDAVLNVSVITPGSWTLSDGVNSYSGILRAGTTNDVEFQNYPFNPPGSGTTNLRISNIFVNPSLTPGAIVPPATVYEITESVSISTGSAFIPIANSQGVVAFTNPSILTTFQGGPSSAPVALPPGTLVGGITGTMGGFGAQDYYSFTWPGGLFSAGVSLTGAPNSNASYLFSEGVTGTCDSIAMVTLNNGNGYSGTITNSNLAAGQYCIGVFANNPADPNYTLSFNTPVTAAQTPEPAGVVLFLMGALTVGLLRVRERGKTA